MPLLRRAWSTFQAQIGTVEGVGVWQGGVRSDQFTTGMFDDSTLVQQSDIWVFFSLGQPTNHTNYNDRSPADLMPSCQAWSCKMHRSRSPGRSAARYPSKATGEPSEDRNVFRSHVFQVVADTQVGDTRHRVHAEMV